jgi:hypothetical protein
MPNQYGDIGFKDIEAGQTFAKEAEASGNVMAERQVDVAQTEAETGAVKGYFDEERAVSRKQNALTEARAQTDQMKRVTKLQTESFDNSLKNERRLAAMDKSASAQLVQKEKEFRTDSFGRKMLSERQLADWYNTRATSEEEWANYSARSAQIYERKMQMLQQAYKVIQNAEQNEYKKWGQQVDQDLMATLAKKKRDLEDKLRKTRNDSANSSALSGALMAAGGAAMMIPGWGWAAGGALIAAGTVVASQNAKKNS